MSSRIVNALDFICGRALWAVCPMDSSRRNSCCVPLGLHIPSFCTLRTKLSSIMVCFRLFPYRSFSLSFRTPRVSLLFFQKLTSLLRNKVKSSLVIHAELLASSTRPLVSANPTRFALFPYRERVCCYCIRSSLLQRGCTSL